MRGRKPKPSGQAVGHRRHPSPMLIGGHPDPGTDFTKPPVGLPKDGRRLWRQEIARLVDARLVDTVDRGALEAMCIAYSRATEARREISRAGMFTAGAAGQVRQHPAVMIEANAWKLYLTLAEQFGMTPVARARLAMAEIGRQSLAMELAESLGEVTLTTIEPEPEP